MLISEVLGKTVADIIKESDENAIKTTLDTIILNLKDHLARNKNEHYTLDQIINELNTNTDTVYIDPRDEDRRNQVMQELENHNLTVDRGTGRIHLGSDDKEKINPDEVKKKDKTREISKKAMDKIKKDSEKGGIQNEIG